MTIQSNIQVRKKTSTKTKLNPYKVNKIEYHPELIDKLRNKSNNTLTQVHLMPSNICNQRCNFCSYRMSDNKNSSDFNDSKMLSKESLRNLINDMKNIGVKAVEVTGGGEPLAHKDKYWMFEELFKAGFDVGLVTNGTLLDDKLAELLAPNLTWMRVSIDAATPQTYSKLRNAPEHHYYSALDSIRKIRSVGNHKSEFRLGAGYVMANFNELEAFDLSHIVKELGVDNIRLSMTFSDKHMAFFTDQSRVIEGIALADKAARELSDDKFQVINLIPERCNNIVDHTNDYPYCYTKDILCVIEGEGNVYTCCTFTGSKKGKLGNFVEHKNGFEGIWEESFNLRRNLNPSKYCDVTCLYAKRNLEMIKIIENANYIPPKNVDAIHVNFI